MIIISGSGVEPEAGDLLHVSDGRKAAAIDDRRYADRLQFAQTFSASRFRRRGYDLHIGLAPADHTLSGSLGIRARRRRTGPVSRS